MALPGHIHHPHEVDAGDERQRLDHAIDATDGHAVLVVQATIVHLGRLTCFHQDVSWENDGKLMKMRIVSMGFTIVHLGQLNIVIYSNR